MRTCLGYVCSMAIQTKILILLVWILVFGISMSAISKQKLYILGLYPLTGSWPAGETILAASRMAVDHINNNSSLLADYELVLVAADSECNGGAAIDAMYKELYNTSTTKLMVLGPGCSLAAEPTAESSHRWNLIQVSYSAASPELSQRDMYPMFFRLCLSGVLYNAMRVSLMRHYDWKKIAVIHQRADLFTLIAADFRRRIEENDMEIVASETFTSDPTSQLKLIKSTGVRIIWGDFYEPQARQVFCEAWKLHMYAPTYVWMIPGWFQSHWWLVRDERENLECTQEQMAVAVNGSFGVYAISLYKDTVKADTLSGLNAEDFATLLGDYIQTDNVESAYGFSDSAYGYDTVWTAAAAIHKADEHLNSRDPATNITAFTYEDEDISTVLLNTMNQLNFNGLTGPVKFSSSGDRDGLLSLTQNQNGSVIEVGLCNLAFPTERQLQLYETEPIIWQGGKVPVDSATEVDQLQLISFGAFVCVVIVSSLGIILAGLFMVFNVLYRNVRSIKMSSPRLNNLMIFGAVLVYISSVFQGIDLNLIHEDVYPTMCKAHLWTFTIGFAVLFGSLFIKTWRVHRIFTTKSVVPKRISDVNLFMKVFMLMLIDAGVLTAWEAFDPLVIHRARDPPIENAREDLIITNVHVSCTSYWYIYWLGALFILNGILLIFGAFLSWETRKVTMPALNDSKEIGTSLYVVTVAAFINVPVSLVLDVPSLRYVSVSLLRIVPTTIVLCLVFIPKITSRNSVMTITTMNTGREPTENYAESSTANPVYKEDDK